MKKIVLALAFVGMGASFGLSANAADLVGYPNVPEAYSKCTFKVIEKKKVELNQLYYNQLKPQNTKVSKDWAQKIVDVRANLTRSGLPDAPCVQLDEALTAIKADLGQVANH